MKRPSAFLFFTAAIAFVLCTLFAPAVLASNEKQAEILLEKGLAAYDAKKYEDAIELWTVALENAPNQYKVYYNRGMAWYKLGVPQKAIDDFTHTLKLNPKHAMAYSSRGYIHKQQGDYEKAKNDFTMALDADPDFYAPYYHLAWIYALCPDEAFRDGEQAVMWAKKAQDVKDTPKTMTLLAAAHAEAGDFTEAVSTQKKAIAWMQRQGMTHDLDSAQAQLRRYQDNRPLVDRPYEEEEVAEDEVETYAGGAEGYAEPVETQEESYEADMTGESVEQQGYTEPQAPEPAPEPEPVASAPEPQPAPAPQPSPEPASAMEYSGPAHPYVIQVSAYKSTQKANDTALGLRRKGDTAFTAHADIPKKGHWYRVFVGCYQTKAGAQQAAAALKERRFTYTNIHKKPWAVSVGDFSDEQAMANMEKALLDHGHLAYRMTGDPGSAVRLLVGAYATAKEAHLMSQEIESAGFPVQIVKR